MGEIDAPPVHEAEDEPGPAAAAEALFQHALSSPGVRGRWDHSKIRIAYIVPSLQVGGAEGQLVKLVENLDPEVFQCTIICLATNPALLKGLGPDVRLWTVGFNWMSRRSALRRLVNGLLLVPTVLLGLIISRPHVVHAYLPAAYVIGALAARLLGVRAIVASRMSLFSIRAYPYPMWRGLAHLANRVIDFHVCDSEASRQNALATEGLDASRTTVIHSGCALPDLSAPLRQLPRSWATGRRELAAINVANLRWEKAHEVLLRSVQTVVRHCPDFRLTVVGDGPRRTAIEELIHDLGLAANVVLAGSVANAAELMPHFHFSVLSSVEESFPNAVIESMAFAVPVVATRVGGVPELVRHGVDGLLVPPGDSAALAEAMLRLLSDPGLRERMAASARERVRDSFSVGRMVRQTDSLYMRLICPPHSREVAE